VQLLGILAAFAAAAAVSVGWFVHLRLSPQFAGFSVRPSVLGVPAALVALTALWLVARGLAEGTARWNFAVVALGSAAFAYAVVAMMCGPTACFLPGASRLVGWFIVGGLALAALAHHVVRERLRTKWGLGRPAGLPKPDDRHIAHG
jgi:hypothetical protein